MTVTASHMPAVLPVLTECCSPVVGRVITPAEADSLATSLKAIADPTRLRLLSLVATRIRKRACAT